MVENQVPTQLVQKKIKAVYIRLITIPYICDWSKNVFF